MESVRTDQETMAEQVSALATAGAESAVRRGGQVVWALRQVVGVAALVALAVLAVLAEMWMLTKEGRLMAVAGIFFCGYLFLVGAVSIYCFFFSPQPSDI
jgi:hypothetical protein